MIGYNGIWVLCGHEGGVNNRVRFRFLLRLRKKIRSATGFCLLKRRSAAMAISMPFLFMIPGFVQSTNACRWRPRRTYWLTALMLSLSTYITNGVQNTNLMKTTDVQKWLFLSDHFLSRQALSNSRLYGLLVKAQGQGVTVG